PAGHEDIPATANLLLSTHASLEAQCAAIADDIAYDAHDLDDAVRARLIRPGDLSDVPPVGPLVREVLERWPKIEPSRQAHEVQRRLITTMIEDVIATSARSIAAAGVRDVDDVRRAGRLLIGFSPQVAGAEKG